MFVGGVGGGRTDCSALYESLKAAETNEAESTVTIKDNHFPVEVINTVPLASVIIVRQANKDIWNIVERRLIGGNAHGVVILGPTGVGKVSCVVIVSEPVVTLLCRDGMLCISWSN